MSIHITQYPISFPQRNTGFLVKRRVESKCKAFEESDDSYRNALRKATHAAFLRFLDSKTPDVGGKVPKSVLLKHVSSELLDIQLKLKSMGYEGHKPSIWVIQGFILTSSKIFNDIVRHVSCLAMKDSLFLGEVPCSDSITDFRPEGYTRKLVEDVLRKNGFAVSLFSYEDLITELNRKLIGKEPYSLDVSSGEKTSFLFVAKQQRLSDDQVDYIRREMELLEDAGDEEGFEDLY